MPRSQLKTMLVRFVDHKGIVHYKLFAQAQMVNQQLFGSADKVTGVCSEEKTRILTRQVDSPP
jgi:hypothetical protein